MRTLTPTRTGWPGTSRAMPAFLAATALVTACSSPGSVPSAAGSDVAPAPTPMTEPDEARQAQFVADGLDEAQATFLAMTAIDGRALGEHEARLTSTLPTGSTAEFTIRLLPDQAGDPAAPPRLLHEADDEFRFTLEYFVPYDALPAAIRDRIRGASAAAPAPVAILASTRHQVAETKDGVTVIVEAVVKQFNSQTTGELVKLLEGRLGNGAEVNNLIKSLKAGDQVRDALASSDEYQKLVREIDALEDCARNPTNPITKRTYRDDPSTRDRILEQVAATRSEVKSHTAAWFLAHMIKTGSSLIRNVPWLGYVVGPGTAWSKAALTDVSRKLIDDLGKNITPCDADFRIDKTVSGSAISASWTIQYTGTKCGGPAGTWEIDSAGTLTGGGDSATIGGPWVVEFPRDATTGTFHGVADFHDDDFGSTQGRFSGIATFTEEPPTLVLQVTAGGGSGYSYGFTDTSIMQPGTLTLPLEAGDFCDDE
jgi:hypothetical protein